MRTGYESLENRKKTAMVFSWQNQQNERDGWGIRTPSRGFDLRPLCGEFSVIRRRVSFRWFDGQKNGVWKLWQSEARATGVFGGQSVLHQTLCLLCRAAVSDGNGPRHRQGTQTGLAHGERARQAVHEGAAG